MTADGFRPSAGRLVTDRGDLASFETPARGLPGRAAAAVQPASVDELRTIVREAVAARVRLVPQGANTGLVGASIPGGSGDDVVLSLDRLTSGVEIHAGDAVAVVGAGCRLSDLNEAAAAHGLHLPVDLGADPTIGGMVATDTGGSRVMRYGTMRRHVLGVEVVAADDDASLLGRLEWLRKDSRGVGVTRLVVGSGGTLGVIARVAVALTPVPAHVQTWWLGLDDAGACHRLLTLLERRRPGALTAFEYLSGAALARCLATEPRLVNPFAGGLPAAAVLAEWSGSSAAVVDGLEADVAAAFEAGLIADGVLVDPAVGWGLRHQVTDVLRRNGTVLGHDISTPPAVLMAARDEACAAVAALAPRAECVDFGHVGDGGLHLNVLFPHDVGPPSAGAATAIRSAIDDVVARHGGSYSAEHGLGPLNAARWLATTPVAEQRVIAALKASLDPYGLLGHPGHPYNLIRPSAAS